MDKKIEKDYVWECDYGERKALLEATKKLLREQDADSLEMFNLFVNNNPYNLELYIVVSYDNPKEGHIETMMEVLSKIGIRYRPDITFQELLSEMSNRRFNSTTLTDETMADLVFNEGFFVFNEKEELASKGYIVNPLGKKMPVFLSHSSVDKPIIEDLIPHLNSAGLPLWYDKFSINYGESIIHKIQQGITGAGAVLFWITPDFLKSRWCKIEMEGFFKRLSSNEDVYVLSIIRQDVNDKDLPDFLLNNKYFNINDGDILDQIIQKIVPILKRHYIDKKKIDLYDDNYNM